MNFTPTGSPGRRPRLQYPQPHGSSSSSLGGMEKAIPSFQTFSNSSIKYVDKPLPPVPTSPPGDYSKQKEIIETYTNYGHKSTTPSIYIQSVSYRSSTSQLPAERSRKPFSKQHQHHSSASLKTRSRKESMATDFDEDTASHYDPRSSSYTVNPALDTATRSKRDSNKNHIASQQAEQYKALLPPRLPTPPGFKALLYDATTEFTVKPDPIEGISFDHELIPHPLSLRTSEERSQSRFSLSSGSDREDDDLNSVARDSFLSHFRLKPSSLESRPSSKTSRNPPSSLGTEAPMSAHSNESSTGTGIRLSALAKEKSNNLRKTLLSIYPKYSKRLLGSKTSQNRQLRIIPSLERKIGGPDTPHPTVTPTSPPTSKAKVFSGIQGHNYQIREVLDTATLGITRNKSETRRRALKKSIVFVGQTDPSGTVADHEWL